ncbi:MAG: lantibiotic dehydratase [Alphaproteobacteria bacterium]|nr:lantibiotic dehydratase [Alphaproteobacteria bacterium]MBV9370821.1 lantibiotic dehydratase [Alphaproteobacteria bacterium]MBV9900099.1 lantibiotic dehydratase [Alphaproteobacteria bacterium]
MTGLDAAAERPTADMTGIGAAGFDESEATPLAAPRPQVAGLILSRRCALDFAALGPLGAEAAMATLAEAERLAGSCAEAAEALAGALFPLVSRCSETERRIVLAVKRAVHNQRDVTPEQAAALIALGGPAVDDALARYGRSRAEAIDARRRAEAQFEATLDGGRRTIATLAGGQDFLKALHLSGRQLVESSWRYSRGVLEEGRCDKASRKMEARLVSFLYRMALKPSPFGSFVELRFHARDSAPSTESAPTRHVVVARMLLLWLVNNLLRYPPIAAQARLRLNPLITWEPDRLTFFRRAEEGAYDMFGRERFVALPRRPAIDRLLAAAARQGSVPALIEEMVGHGEDEATVRAVLERLIECGAIERTLNIPDQTLRYARAAAEAFASMPGEAAERASQAFANIDAMETEFAEADVAGRISLVGRLYGEIESASAISGDSVPGPEGIKTYFYEEVGSRVPADAIVPEIPESVVSDLADLTPAIGLFDEILIERLALYHFFRERFGESGAPVPLLDMYKAFSSLAPEEIDRRLAGGDCPEVAALSVLRREWIQEVRARLAEHGGDEVDLRAVAPDLFRPPHRAFARPWDSASFYLQPSDAAFGGPIAMNGATMGHGAAMARFCSVLEERSELGAVLRRSDERAFPEARRADLTAVLGTNTNLHPPVWAEQIEYPGSLAADDGRPVLHLNALAVSADPDTHRLVLTSEGDPRPIDLTPLNALYPTIGPSLYRFLSLLSPYGNFRSRAWLLHLTERGRGLSGLPRIRYGSIVLQRRCRIVGADAAATLAETDPMTLEGLAAFEAWRRAHDLPRRGFYSGFAEAGSGRGRSTVEAVLKQSRQMRLRKPHFYDFANPFLMRALRAHLSANPELSLLFEECLPDAACYEGGGPSRAEEFIVQLDVPRR